MKRAPATFINIFMSIILPMDDKSKNRRPLVAAYIAIYIQAVYIYRERERERKAHNFCFSDKVKYKKMSEGIGRKVQLYITCIGAVV